MAETLVSNCTPTQRIPSILSKWSPIAGKSSQFPNLFPHKSYYFNPIPSIQLQRPLKFPAAAAASSSSSSSVTEHDKNNEGPMGVDSLRQFIDLNLGKWNGSLYQFDVNGNLLQNVSTRLSASSYGVDELTSLIQTLYIKQPPTRTSIEGHGSEPEWAEYKIKETNLFTVDKYQQIGFFPREKAFALRYQTAGMLEAVLRAGVLGEDDTGEDSPKNLKIPSRRPSVVCENCLYSLQRDMRARAFHIMDPKGVLDTLLIFLEERGSEAPHISASCSFEDISTRITPVLGRWEGHSVTKRSGVYGATIAEADTISLLEMDDEGHLIQDITSTSARGATTNVHWAGTITNNLVNFDGGFQITLLPGGMYMGCPCDISKSVAQYQCFHLEFCWMESPDRRQRLIRTYDVEGLAVSSTHISETKGPFGMSHQQALAQVTAQAVQSHSQMHSRAEFPSSQPTATTTSVAQSTGAAINMAPYQQMPPQSSDANNNSFESGNISHCNHRSQSLALVVDKPVDDGYNWRKYGQKQVKGSEFPRSYYKCTHSSCPVKKKVERSLEGQVTEIIYKGQHNHPKPPPNRRAKEGGSMANGSSEFSGNLHCPDNAESVSQGGNFSRSGEISKRERESGHGTSEQLSGSSDGDEVGDAEVGQDEHGDSESDPKRRAIDARETESTSSHRTVTEPRIIVQTTSEVDLLEDGYRWRKYGQKVVKGNPNPRSYYKCTTAGCNVRKHVERASTDQKAVITTYEGKHNHDVPAARNSSHNTANATAAANSSQTNVYNPVPSNQAFLKREDLRNNVDRPVAVLQLKEEHNMP